MKIVSLNAGRAEPLSIGKKVRKSGIFKRPLEGPVVVGKLGLESDVQVDQKHHGGADQALYFYSQEDYDWWERDLGRKLPPGTFGENITLSSYGEGPVFIGDTLELGELVVQVTAPRIPCGTLAARMDDPTFVKRFVRAERPGFYARVQTEGILTVNSPVRWIERGTIGLLDTFKVIYSKQDQSDLVMELLKAPIASRLRDLLTQA